MRFPETGRAFGVFGIETESDKVQEMVISRRRQGCNDTIKETMVVLGREEMRYIRSDNRMVGKAVRYR